jgi:hypothetical protein
VAQETEEHSDEKEGSDLPPNVSEQEIGGKEKDDDKKIEQAEKEFLLTEKARVGRGPVA